MEILLVADTASTLRVEAETVSGIKLIGAEILLERPGYSETINASTCGQAFFSGLSANTDYELTVSPDGYPPQTISALSIAADEVVVVKF